MFITNPDTTQPVESPSGEIVRELGGASAGGLGEHSVAHISLPPGKSAARHYHPEHEESYFILGGTGQMEIDGVVQRLKAGDMVAIQRNQVHKIWNEGADDLVFLAMCAPPWTPTCSVFLED